MGQSILGLVGNQDGVYTGSLIQQPLALPGLWDLRVLETSGQGALGAYCGFWVEIVTSSVSEIVIFCDVSET